ncbi:MAG TPA: zf-TFIIB domain-containing protein [Gemmatimonadaceae bacterium]|nr:zf-TFIIB domain-containing protein [Gemmatimonadaceae bacterium]
MTPSDEKPSIQEQKYFADQDQELIRQMRARLDAQRQTAPAATLQCPKCDGTLHEEALGDVKVDRCDSCQGLWLDAGELELLARQGQQGSRGFFDSIFRRQK